MSRLGHLALQKEAQQAPASLFDLLRQGHASDIQQGRYTSPARVGPTAEQASGFVTPTQGVQGALGSLLGPVGSFLGGVGTPAIQNILGRMGVDPNAAYQFQYGGDPQAFQEQQRILQELQLQQLANRGEVAGRLVDAIGGFVQDKFGVDPSMVTSWLKSMPAPQLGMFVQQISSAVPELETVMSRIDPTFVTDFQPILTATYMRNQGEFDEGVFRKTLNDFNQAYQSGQFAGVPAQVAMHSFAKATEDLGPQATMQDAANLAKAADSFVRAGLAPSFGEAMTLVGSIDPTGKSFKDPSKAVSYAQHLDRLARQGAVDKTQIYQATQLARQHGISPNAAIQAVMTGQSARQKLGPSGGRYADMAADAVTRLGKSDNMKLLSALYESTPGARKQIESAIRKGDTRALSNLATRARYDANIMARREYADPEALIDQIAFSSPEMLQDIVYNEARQHAKATGNRQLQRLIADPKALQKRLSTRDFSGLNTATVRALSAQGPTGGRLAGAAVGAGGADRPQGIRTRRPQPQQAPTPQRLGMQYAAPQPPKAPAPLPQVDGWG